MRWHFGSVVNGRDGVEMRVSEVAQGRNFLRAESVGVRLSERPIRGKGQKNIPIEEG